MKKTIYVIATLLMIFILLTACSSPANSPSDSNTGDASSVSQNGEINLTERTKLILGTLKLENTDFKITKEQAAELLPEWKVLRNLLASDSASQVEIDALQNQIKGTLTAEQLEWIDNLSYTNEGYQIILKELLPEGIAFGGNGSLTQAEMEARRSTMVASNGGSLPEGFTGNRDGAGGGAVGGFQGGGPAGNFVPGAEGGFPGGAPGTYSSTPGANTGIRQGRQGGQFDSILIDSLITLLESK